VRYCSLYTNEDRLRIGVVCESRLTCSLYICDNINWMITITDVFYLVIFIKLESWEVIKLTMITSSDYHDTSPHLLAMAKVKKPLLGKKFAVKVVSSRQFHQHFTYEFFVRTSFHQLFSSYVLALRRNSYKKFV